MLRDEEKLPNPTGLSEGALGRYWAQHCDFDKYVATNSGLDAVLAELGRIHKLVIFSNGPREYCLRVLSALGVRERFADDMIFCVDDVAPDCKPEPAAFNKVLQAIGSRADRCVMFEGTIRSP